jgi:GNAT superfamily N-acetyltransferase
MRALRTHYTDEAEFVRRVDADQRPQGYRIVAAFEDEGVGAHPAKPGASAQRAVAVAVAGFRVLRTLFSGDVLYVDDLSTHPDARRRGHAAALLDWCAEEGRRLGCDEIHLDSAVIPERQDAHRLYFNRRMRIASYHFVRPL